jgi:hypothetical protein
MPCMRFRWQVAIGLAVLVGVSSAASAHEKKGVGALSLTIGWGDEPAFSGSKNYVEVDVADAAGAPVVDPAARLTVEVFFGAERMSLQLQPAGTPPGKFRAWLVPTRPGTYAFRITGTVRGQAVETTSTCSDTTFACVTDVADVQFPVKDPSAGQLADRVDRATPRAERAIEMATGARTVAIGAVAMAIAALAGAIGVGVRKGRKSA